MQQCEAEVFLVALACHGLQARAMRTDCLITPSLQGPEVIEQVSWDGCFHTQPDLPPVPGCPSTFGSREHLCHNELNFQLLQTYIQAVSLPTATHPPCRQCFSTNSPLPHLAVHCGQAHLHSAPPPQKKKKKGNPVHTITNKAFRPVGGEEITQNMG